MTHSYRILTLYKQLRSIQTATFEGKNYFVLRKAISDVYRNGEISLRDVVQDVEQALETSIIVSEEIGMSPEGIKACLIVPFMKDESQIATVRSDLGDGVCTIIEGIINIRHLYQKNTSIETENFRNLLVSFAKDMRVILIMIADCVNMMRKMSILRSDNKEESDIENLPAYTPEFIERIAKEASFLYAPLAHKLGLYTIKSELEDLSLKILNHDAYYHIKEKLNSTKTERDRYIEAFIGPIQQRLEAQGLKFHIKGRTKSIHSIWQKMQKQHCPFEGVYDLFAIRIILDAPLNKEKQLCWQTYSIITDMYQPNPKRLRDWLSVPKSNGYESLHITVLGPENKWVEVQIRTERMDDIAEHGLAAHWRYKGVKQGEKGIDTWLSAIRNALEATRDEGDAMAMMDQLHTDLKTDEVYVFTPKGDLHRLVVGATVLDFAYSIHTNIGDHCTGAIVNGRNASMRRQLHSGDQVTILTSPSQTPKPAWLDYVVTGRAKSKIRQSLNEMRARQTGMAKEMLERKFHNRHIDLNANTLNTVIRKLGFKDVNDFYIRVGNNQIDINVILETYQQVVAREKGEAEPQVPLHKADEFVLNEGGAAANSGIGSGKNEELVIDRNVKGLDYTLAHCCNPVYGDDIFGFITINKGIRIHRTTCPNAAAMKARFPYRIVKARWAGERVGTTYPIVLHIVGQDNLGVVNNITSILSKEEQVNIRSFRIDSDDGLFRGTLTIMVNDTHQLDGIIKKLKTVKGVKNVTR